MRCLFLVIALSFCQFRVQSQDRYFLYLQTDNEQAFYARVQGRTLSSSANGYLILPRISDSALTITIGFPKRIFPEQTFEVRNIRSDKGYLLKNLPEKGWALVDMQGQDMLMSASAAPTRTTEPTAKAAADPFSELLSTVIADSSLTATPILVTTPPPPVKTSLPTQPSKSVDSSVVVQSRPPVTVAAPKAETPVPAVPENNTPRPAGSRKLLEQIDGSGVQLVFSDETSSGKPDTISVFIPKDKSAQISPQPKPVGKVPETPDSSQTISRSVPDRSDCKSFINTRDLGLLKRRMEMLTDEDAKVALALRSFRETCFSTEQIRNLLLVFGREEGRFKLLDAAYPYVSDPSRFPELESVLKDSYFIYRFRKKTSATVRQ